MGHATLLAQMACKPTRVLGKSRVLAATCVALMAGACSDPDPDGLAPAGWTAWESTEGHLRVRSGVAGKALIAARGSSTPDVRTTAIQQAIIARVPLGAAGTGPSGQLWHERLVRAIHASEFAGPGADLGSEFATILNEPGVRDDLDARRLCQNALGCDFVRRAQRGSAFPAMDAARRALIERAIEQFDAATGLPEAAVNLAAALIEHGRLGSDAGGADRARARRALESLEADALSVPSRPDSFLGLPARGGRIAILLDVSDSVPADALAAAKLAVLGAVDSLRSDSAIGVWAFGGDVRAMQVAGGGAFRAAGAGGSAATVRAAVGAFLDGVVLPGKGGLLRAVAQAAAAGASDIMVFTVPANIGDDPGAARIGPELAQRGIAVDAFVLAPGFESDPGIRSALERGALGLLVRYTSGRMRILLGGSSSPLTGQSRRELAEREGRWTPALDRQWHAVRSQLLMAEEGSPNEVTAAARSIGRALAPLEPDPVAVAAGPARSDIRCLMLAGTVAVRAGDAEGADRCFREAAELAGASASSSAVQVAATLREQGARAELLRALHGAPLQQCMAHAEQLGLLAGTWSRESWSARLLEASAGGLAAFRAGRSLASDPGMSDRQARELALVRAWASDGRRPLTDLSGTIWDDLPSAGDFSHQGAER